MPDARGAKLKNLLAKGATGFVSMALRAEGKFANRCGESRLMRAWSLI
jgi:hypothetical protein